MRYLLPSVEHEWDPHVGWCVCGRSLTVSTVTREGCDNRRCKYYTFDLRPFQAKGYRAINVTFGNWPAMCAKILRMAKVCREAGNGVWFAKEGGRPVHADMLNAVADLRRFTVDIRYRHYQGDKYQVSQKTWDLLAELGIFHHEPS
jgi:hypothetical protein